MHTLFLLSPANSGGERAKLIFNPNAGFDLAKRMQRGEPQPIGEVYSFLSGLYFRGKLAYARAFADPPKGAKGALVITTNRGLLDAETLITLADLREFARVNVLSDDPRYREPLLRDAQSLTECAGKSCRVVLLGSIATGKYVDALLETFGERLLFPSAFVGRGDLSRGGLCLRSAADGVELEYSPVLGAKRTGARPPKLPKRTYPVK